MPDAVRRVAVTGAAGYLAGCIIERLEREESIEHILALDIRPPKRPHPLKVAFVRHSVTEPMDRLFAEHGVQSVIHLAYVMNPGHRRTEAHRVNVGGTVKVIEACLKAGVRHIVYLSSTSVYGARPDNPPLLTEAHPASPLRGFQYSEDKAAAESLILDAASKHPELRATILRVCPVMGAHADNFIAQAFSKPALVAVRGFDPPIQLIHEDDLVDAICLALTRQPSGVYNLGARDDIRWSEMARLFGKRMITLPAWALYGMVKLTWALRLQSDSPPCGVNFIRYPWVASTEKAEREFGFAPQHTSRDAWEAFVTKRGM